MDCAATRGRFPFTTFSGLTLPPESAAQTLSPLKNREQVRVVVRPDPHSRTPFNFLPSSIGQQRSQIFRSSPQHNPMRGILAQRLRRGVSRDVIEPNTRKP